MSRQTPLSLDSRLRGNDECEELRL